jgi:hypothetical protein
MSENDFYRHLHSGTVNPRNCPHQRWVDDTQPYEEHIVLKCDVCGVFRGTDDPNPNYDADLARQQDMDFAEGLKHPEAGQ